MNGNPIARRTGSGRNLLALLASSAVFMAGCSNLATIIPTAMPQSTGGTISGSVHGGSQPVAFSTVTLYYAGQNGVGSGAKSISPDPPNPSLGAAIVAAQTQSALDGSFSFQKLQNGQATSGNQFSCPGDDPLVYVIARGGNTLNTQDSSVNNSAAAFMAIYGLCSQIGAGNVVVMNEVTTVATMIALQQYFNPFTESVGADGIGVHKAALQKTIDTISNLADMSHGNAVSSKVITGSVAGVSVTVTPEAEKINALANIIASCVNNRSASNSPCNTLFTNAAQPDVTLTDRPYHSPSFPVATDVLQALYYILANPTNGDVAKLNNLFNLIPLAGAPFQPSLTSAPTDWTVAVNYKTSDTCGSSSGNFINGAQDINLDSAGNLWIGNGQDVTGNLTEISPGGVPLSCVFLGGGNSHGVTIDASGNIWYASHSTNAVYRYKPSDQSVQSFATVAPPLAIFADGGNVALGANGGDGNSNIYFTTDADSSVYKISQGAGAPVQISSTVGSNPSHLMVDTTQAIWVTSGSNFISRIAPSSNSADANYLNGYTTTKFQSLPTDTYGITVNATGTGGYVTSTGSNSSIASFVFNAANNAITTSWTASAGLAGLNNPTSIALDGRLNVWTPNNSANSAVGNAGSVSAVSYLGNAMMPSGTVAGGRQLPSNLLSGGRSIVIDLSGNVWVAGDGALSANSITEIVGAAVPIYQPYSVGLTAANPRFQRLP
jgi:hypothetical protein